MSKVVEKKWDEFGAIYAGMWTWRDQKPVLLTWIDLNPSMDKKLDPL